jgi:hypothetical protein
MRRDTMATSTTNPLTRKLLLPLVKAAPAHHAVAANARQEQDQLAPPQRVLTALLATTHRGMPLQQATCAHAQQCGALYQAQATSRTAPPAYAQTAQLAPTRQAPTAQRARQALLAPTFQSNKSRVLRGHLAPHPPTAQPLLPAQMSKLATTHQASQPRAALVPALPPHHDLHAQKQPENAKHATAESAPVSVAESESNQELQFKVRGFCNMYLMAIRIQLRSRNALTHAQAMARKISTNVLLPPGLLRLEVLLPPKLCTNPEMAPTVEKQRAGWFSCGDHDVMHGDKEGSEALHALYAAKYGDMSPSAWKRWRIARKSMLQARARAEGSSAFAANAAGIMQGTCMC